MRWVNYLGLSKVITRVLKNGRGNKQECEGVREGVTMEAEAEVMPSLILKMEGAKDKEGR